MPLLKVKKLHPDAILPQCAHPGSDLGLDLFALEDTLLPPGFTTRVTAVETGVSLEMEGYGFIIKDRSSMAANGVFTHGGVIDQGYTGPIKVLLTSSVDGWHIKAGDKIAQIIPIKADYVLVEEVESLSETERGAGGFGSTGK